MELLRFVILVCLLAWNDSAPMSDNIFTWEFWRDLGKGIFGAFPSSEEEEGNRLPSLPEMFGSELITDLCTLGNDNPITPDMKYMSFILHSKCKKLKFPLTQVEQLLSSPRFDVNKKVVIYVVGWMSTPEEDYVADMAQAFACRGDYNFLVLDSSYYIATLYTWSAHNTEEIGRQVALGLKELIKNVKADSIHLIGHSLGAHIVGYAGRYFTEYTGLKLSRITGLDPANPCFNKQQRGLQRGDAEFVDVIHTDPDVFGLKYPLGDADFYPEGFADSQPGCLMIGCSHGRANEYFIESVYPGNENNFMATLCNSLKDLKHGSCNGDQYPMGLAFTHNMKGNYFLNVNSEKPYGQNHVSRNANVKKCRKC